MESDKFRNKYRIPSARAQWWDYGWNGAYFVTICTKNRKHFFGKIMNGSMVLSEMGHIANTCWMEIPAHFPFVKLGEFVVMPNHVHGIVIIDKPDNGGDVSPTNEPTPNKPKNQFGPQSKNLGSIIRGFKTGVTKNARIINPGFEWQPRFHDHIIRDHAEYNRISRYIRNNPAKWNNDKFNTNGL